MKDKDYHGITLLKEENFSIVDTNIRMWTENGIPFEKGEQFPPADMQLRSNINKTMNALVSNEFEGILDQYLADFPDMEPIMGAKIRNIMANLPVFDMIVRTWKLLLSPCFEGIEIRGQNREDVFNIIQPCIDDIIKNMFTCCDRAVVSYKNNDRINIKVYADKNLMVFRTSKDEYITTITNVILHDDANLQDRLECISYLPDDSVVRDVFEYSGGVIGEHIDHTLLDIKRNVVFRKNGSGNDTYGYPEIVGCLSSPIAVMRAFNTLAKLIERNKELLRIVPGSSIRKDPATGQAAFALGSTVAYDDNAENKETAQNIADYKTPDLDIEGAIKSLEEMLKTISLFSGLSGVILGTTTISGNDSGRSLIVSCVPTMLHANGYIRRLIKEVKELVVEVVRLLDDTVNVEDIKVNFSEPDKTLLKLISGAEEEKEQQIK